MAHQCNCNGTEKTLPKVSIGLLERPRYSPGLILEDSDLTAAVNYTREPNRLLFRSLFGCGVVCGLTVKIGIDCGLQVTVAPGLALDGCGDALQLTGSVTIKLGEHEGFPSNAATRPREGRREFWVIACAGEKQCAPRALVCDGDDLDGTPAPTRTRATVEISVSLKEPECVCGCKRRDQQAEAAAAPAGDAGVPAAPELSYPFDPHGCHKAHRENPDCPADCGCGSACACGCCVLLAHVHWVDKPAQWAVSHDGVRRFIRPLLLPDPMGPIETRAAAAALPAKPEEKEKAGIETNQAAEEAKTKTQKKA